MFSSEEAKVKVMNGLKKICDPVVSTLGVNGGHVLYQNDVGNYMLTKDGVTVAKNITLRDYIEDGIATIVKEGSLRTNNEAGDGTTTTVLFTRELVKTGLDMIGEGTARRRVVQMLDQVEARMLEALETEKRTMTEERMMSVAMVASNYDEEIATNSVKICSIAGVMGHVIIDISQTPETDVTNDAGYVVNVGMNVQELYPNRAQPMAKYNEAVGVFITDGRFYYRNDADRLMRQAIAAGYKTLVIVARDCAEGTDAFNQFVSNHSAGKINIVLIKLEDATVRNDLAIYLGTKVYSEKVGQTFNKVENSDIRDIPEVFVDRFKMIAYTHNKDTKEIAELIATVKEGLVKTPDDISLTHRLGSLTVGTVTLKVGANTPVERREKVDRYEDAINAIRSALRSGYVVGGGVTMRYAANNALEGLTDDGVRRLIDMLGSATIHEIAQDKFDSVIGQYTATDGLDTLNGVVTNLEGAGIIESFLVAQQTVRNAVSVAKSILSIENFVIIDDVVEEEDK